MSAASLRVLVAAATAPVASNVPAAGDSRRKRRRETGVESFMVECYSGE